MKIITLLAALIINTYQPTYQHTISGTVLDNNGEYLFLANIQIQGTGIGTSTDENGNFILTRIPHGIHTLIISYVGFEAKRFRFHTDDISETDFSFTLKPSLNMPQIELIGKSPERFERIPGSASIITHQSLERINPLSGSEVFRTVPGVHAVEQEGLGLRANIGIRGLDPSASRNVLMMEDGIPVALAPYGEPEMYYSPAMNRMAGVEVVKGSGSILYGPQTFGGVINYITHNPPAESQGDLHIRGGESQFMVARGSYGNTIGKTGFLVSYLHKSGNEVGTLDFSIHDVTTKLRFNLSGKSFLGAKLGFYDEQSNSTYVGLSQGLYATGDYDFHPLGDVDHLSIRRYSASLTHNYFFSDKFNVKTTVFAYTTTRNWSREDFDNIFNPNRNYSRIVGAPNAEGAIYFRGTTGNRNRAFEVAGVEPRFSLNYDLADMRNELDFGARFLFERAYEQRINGTVDSPTTGDLRDDEIRTGYALSAYVQNKTYLNEQFTVTPGVRLEHFIYERDILRLNHENTDIINTDLVTALIPGLGLNYRLGEGTAFYAGVHRGFGPPRVKDAISSTGISEELDAEFSWNYEVGARARFSTLVSTEFTVFYMDFSNQVIPVAEAAGGQGATGTASLTNGGVTVHRGLESTLNLHLSPLLGTWGLDFIANFTFTNAEFSEDRFVQSGGESVNVKGNTLPYAPEIMISSGMYMSAPIRVSLDMNATYIGEQFGDVLNTIPGSANGRSGQIPGYFVLDANANYYFRNLAGTSVNFSVKNLLNERYIVSRRPQGIRVGMPRFIAVGFDWKF